MRSRTARSPGYNSFKAFDRFKKCVLESLRGYNDRFVTSYNIIV